MSVPYILLHPSSPMSVHFRDLKGHKDLLVSLDQKGQMYVASMDLDFFLGFDQTEFTIINLVFDIFC